MKILIIGYGSIGRRHARVLSKIKKVSTICILTQQKIKKYRTIKSYKEIKYIDPDYVVISNENDKHYKTLMYLENNFKNINILVEKPLFNKFINLNIKNNYVYVGYNLRFHPLILKLKNIIKKRKIWNVLVTSGSFLPNWRKNIDYKSSYSSKKKSGGVLLDLSHEIDYVSWLFGDLKILHSLNNRLSDLKISSDDNLNLSAKTKNNINIQINLNYFFKIPKRQILVDGKNLSIDLDLISNKLKIIDNNKLKQYKLTNYNINKMYENQHNEIIYNKVNNICSYADGKKINYIIDKIKKY